MAKEERRKTVSIEQEELRGISRTVAEILSATLDSRRLLKRVALKVAQVCRVDRCTLELWDGDRVIPLMSQFADGRTTPAMWERFQSAPMAGPLATIPANAQVLETRQPLLIEDCATSSLIPAEWVVAFGLKTCLIVARLLSGSSPP